MSEWDEDRAELLQRIRYLTKLSQQGKKWAVGEMIVELTRLMGWYANRRHHDEWRDRSDQWCARNETKNRRVSGGGFMV